MPPPSHTGPCKKGRLISRKRFAPSSRHNRFKVSCICSATTARSAEREKANSCAVRFGRDPYPKFRRKELSMSLLIGAMTIGLILSLLALGVFITFRIFEFPDVAADGSSTFGAAVAAALIVKGTNPLIASAAGFAAGFAAGSLTGVLATKFKINGLLAGILVMTALYSVNLHIMGRSNVPLLTSTTLSTYA